MLKNKIQEESKRIEQKLSLEEIMSTEIFEMCTYSGLISSYFPMLATRYQVFPAHGIVC